MPAYYNENDPFAASVLRNLIAAGLIAPGEVDERDIRDVRPGDVNGYSQCHWFAGIGVWSFALRLAGWTDDRPVWTGSCPCQPFSAAGRGRGLADERHLWPAWHHLIEVCRPATVFGEQVASAAGLEWFDIVSTDLEASKYAVGAADLCAAGVGAPHIRQRLWFVAEGMGDANSRQCDRIAEHGEYVGNRQARGRDKGDSKPTRYRKDGRMADIIGSRLEGFSGHGDERRQPGWKQPKSNRSTPSKGPSRRMADRNGREQRQAGSIQSFRQHRLEPQDRGDVREDDCRSRDGFAGRLERPGPVNGYWRDADWLFCRDAKWRPTRPGSFPLVDGTPARVGRLRCYGNAIVAQVAQAFIEAYLEARRDANRAPDPFDLTDILGSV